MLTPYRLKLCHISRHVCKKDVKWRIGLWANNGSLAICMRSHTRENVTYSKCMLQRELVVDCYISVESHVGMV
jgi:hypothetical protein